MDEKTADLKELEQMSQATQFEQAAIETQVPTLANEIEGLIQIVVNILKPVLPSLPAVYTETQTKMASEAIADVCNKHGFLQGGLMGKYAEEIACLAICAPLGYATYEAVQRDLAANKAKQLQTKSSKENDIVEHNENA